MLLSMRRAFTLIEVLLVIGLVSFLTGISMPMYRNYQIRNDLSNAAEQVGQAIGRAKLLSQSGHDDAEWGYSAVHGVLYKGRSYETRDPAYDEVYPMPDTIAATGLIDLWFSKLDGRPSATGTIVLTTISGEQRTINIIIDSDGIPLNDDDRLIICHCPNGAKTLSVAEAAWPGHQGHGDYLGYCTATQNHCAN